MASIEKSRICASLLLLSRRWFKKRNLISNKSFVSTMDFLTYLQKDSLSDVCMRPGVNPAHLKSEKKGLKKVEVVKLVGHRFLPLIPSAHRLYLAGCRFPIRVQIFKVFLHFD